MKRLFVIATLFSLGLLMSACRSNENSPTAAQQPSVPAAENNVAEPTLVAPDACDLVLVAHQGTGKTDREIIRLQKKIVAETEPSPWIEQLGWNFIAKARESFDPGYYKLAEQCAFCLEAHTPHCAAALLLRGHVLQNLHRFKEAEPLARELVATRGLAYDYGLLGDVLMEQGRLNEAVEAYQKMVDLKPDLQAYARIANVRWLKGDLSGATEVMRLATGAASPNAPEVAAWVNTRLAFFRFEQGDLTQASETCDAALGYQGDYAPALLLQGRLLLANGDDSGALEALRQAAKVNPLPDYQWVLIEALQASGLDAEAQQIENSLTDKGAAADPRTYALYLATSGHSPELALQLAKNEFTTRSDVFTHDAMAWALAANGRNEEAWQEMQSALAEGTKDGRLYFHAAAIAAKAGHTDEAQAWLGKANGMAQTLLPSEQRQLVQTAAQLGQVNREDTATTTSVETTFNSGN